MLMRLGAEQRTVRLGLMGSVRMRAPSPRMDPDGRLRLTLPQLGLRLSKRSRKMLALMLMELEMGTSPPTSGPRPSRSSTS